MMQTLKFKTVFCIIDALDECDVKTARDLVSDLLRLMSSSKTPMKIFFSSRLNVNIERHLSTYSSISAITMDWKLIHADIDKVVKHRLKLVGRELDLTQDEEDQIREEIVGRADGMFLWAILAVNEIENIEDLADDLNPADLVRSLPADLPKLYDRMWGRLPQDTLDLGGRTLKKSEFILAWVLLAGRPMTLSEFRPIIAIREGDTSFKDIQSRIVRNIRTKIKDLPFLEIPTTATGLLGSPGSNDDRCSTVRLIHQSAKDYLEPKLKFYEKILARLCITMLKFKEFSDPSWQENIPDGPEGATAVTTNPSVIPLFRSRLASFDPLDYVGSFWFAHLRAAGDLDDNTISLVHSFIAEEKMLVNVRVWLQIMNFNMFGFPTYIDSPAIHISSSLGLANITRYLIAHGHDVNERDSANRLPLQVALTFHTDPETCMALKENMQHICEGWVPSDPNFAAMCGQQESLDYSEQPDILGRTILHYACAGANLTTIQEVLERFPKVQGVKDAYGACCWDLLINAASRESMESMDAPLPRNSPDNLSKARGHPCLAPTINIGNWIECFVCKVSIDGYYHRKFSRDYTVQTALAGVLTLQIPKTVANVSSIGICARHAGMQATGVCVLQKVTNYAFAS
jgi:hypothetical protein